MRKKNLGIAEMLYSRVMWARACGSPDNRVERIFTLCFATVRFGSAY